jgi:hypothetical protein
MNTNKMQIKTLEIFEVSEVVKHFLIQNSDYLLIYNKKKQHLVFINHLFLETLCRKTKNKYYESKV